MFTKSKYDDKKKILCIENGVKLFIVPEIPYGNTDKAEYIKQHIRKQGKSLRVMLPENLDDMFIDINKTYQTPNSLVVLRNVQEVAKRKGGVCLSVSFVRSDIPLEFKCNTCDTVWNTKAYDILNDRVWCPKCNRLTYSLDDAIKCAEAHNGKCLSQVYEKCYALMRWECQLGHRWMNTFGQVHRGQWCPECQGKTPKYKLPPRLDRTLNTPYI